ncbi:MAG TPA: sugar ABC transporter permease [Gaiellaceae bacterium]|jgi:raffinose/stachyose/melibiose transport system permease protein|nr:sugar ABC transporter permease [Gaiellaceae bacterium]
MQETAGAGKLEQGASPLLALPALVLFALFALVPMGVVVALSFTNYNGISAPTSAGLANWSRFLHDSTTHHAIWLSLEIMLLSWAFQTPLSILLGVFVAGRERYRAVLAAIFFLPLLFSAAAIAVTWKNLLDPNFGLVQNLAHRLHADRFPLDWLGSPSLALYTVVFIISWQFIPFHMLLYQAGARQIPLDVYEAAEIDGAGRSAKFWKITLPLLRNTIVTSSTLIVVGSLTYFDLVFILTGGGPGFATRILPLDMYINGFQANELGYASAISVVLVAAGLGLSMLLIRLTGFGKFRSAYE